MRELIEKKLDPVLERYRPRHACTTGRQLEIGDCEAHAHGPQDVDIGKPGKRKIEVLRVLRRIEHIRNIEHQRLGQTLTVLRQGRDIAPPQIEQIVSAARIGTQALQKFFERAQLERPFGVSEELLAHRTCGCTEESGDRTAKNLPRMERDFPLENFDDRRGDARLRAARSEEVRRARAKERHTYKRYQANRGRSHAWAPDRILGARPAAPISSRVVSTYKLNRAQSGYIIR